MPLWRREGFVDDKWAFLGDEASLPEDGAIVVSLKRWLAERNGMADVATLKQYVDILPKYLTRRFISQEQDAVVVSGRVPDADANNILPLVQDLDHKLDRVRTEFPGYEVAVTGLSALAARNSALMID